MDLTKRYLSMNENKKGLRGIHPDLKRLYQPIAEKAVSEATISTIPTLDKKILNTWQGYLLDTPGGKAPNTANGFTDLIEHDFESIDGRAIFWTLPAVKPPIQPTALRISSNMTLRA